MAELTVKLDLSFGKRSLGAMMAAAMMFSAVSEVASESITLTTYYPAPSGVYSQMITTGNTYLARDGGNVGIGTTSPVSKLEVNGDIRGDGNLVLSPANPSITSGGSYIVVPNGMYFSGGTAYFQNQIQTRGGVHDDTNSNLTLYGGTSGNTAVNGSLLINGYETNYGILPHYQSWAAYGTGDGGAAIYNDNNGYKTLMLVGNASAGAERRVSVWDSFNVNGGGNNGTIALTATSCAEVQYNINGVTTCAAAGFGGASYVTVQAGVISSYVSMPYYTNPAGQQQGGLAPMLCCTCPSSGCPL